MLPRRRKLRWTLAALAILPVVGELGLRVSGAAFRYPSPCALVDGRGCMMLPGLHETVAVAGDRFSFTTNSRGLRNREATPEDSSRRHVVVLGDSAAFGAHVDDAEVFTVLLDERLASHGAAVINAGSPYLKGTDQQLRYLMDEGAVLAPDVVVLVFNGNNDVSDNSREEFFVDGVPQPWKPRLLQRLVTTSARLPGYGSLTDHSWLFGAFSFFYFNAHVRFGAPPNLHRAEATESVLRSLQSECRRRGADLMMVLLPQQKDVPERLSSGHFPHWSPEELVVDVTTRLGIRVLDESELVAAPGAIVNDGHLSVAGHRALADALTPQLTLALDSKK
jgi:lysophospholipase L1-like esterase